MWIDSFTFVAFAVSSSRLRLPFQRLTASFMHTTATVRRNRGRAIKWSFGSPALLQKSGRYNRYSKLLHKAVTEVVPNSENRNEFNRHKRDLMKSTVTNVATALGLVACGVAIGTVGIYYQVPQRARYGLGKPPGGRPAEFPGIAD